MDEALSAVKLEIRRKMNSLADHLADGKAESYDQYRYLCGFLQGLGAVEQFIKEVERKLSDE